MFSHHLTQILVEILSLLLLIVCIQTFGCFICAKDQEEFVVNFCTCQEWLGGVKFVDDICIICDIRYDNVTIAS